jgi:formiminoglutamate deiminase
MSVLWCERAWLGDGAVRDGVTIELAGETIEAVRTEVGTPPDGARRLRGLVIPGLANAHSHAFQRALRGRTHAVTGSFWTWRKHMYALAAALDPDSMLALSRATFAEMVLAGVTLVGEFHYVHHSRSGAPYEDPNAMAAAVIEAAAAAGIRLTLLDACYLHGGIEPDPVQQRFCDRDVEAWCERVAALSDGPRARVGAAIHSMRAVQPEPAAVVARWARERSLPLHAHVSEQRAENEACIEVYGATPTGILHYAGALDDRFTAVHATHLTDEDVALLGKAGVCCCLCPTTERDLADGIGPAGRLRDAGARLALGTDSNALIEPFEEARAVELDERLAGGVRGVHAAPALLGAATRCGYESLGWPGGGVIAPGAPADLVAVRTDGVHLAGAPREALLETLVFAGAAADVSDVIVAGEFVVEDGRHVSIDVPAALSAAIAQVAPV